MSAPITSSYVNYMTIVMFLYVVYNGMITSGNHWFPVVLHIISVKKKG